LIHVFIADYGLIAWTLRLFVVFFAHRVFLVVLVL